MQSQHLSISPPQALSLSSTPVKEGGGKWRRKLTCCSGGEHLLHQSADLVSPDHYTPVSVFMLTQMRFLLFCFKQSILPVFEHFFLCWTYPKQNNGIGAEYCRKIRLGVRKAGFQFCNCHDQTTSSLQRNISVVISFGRHMRILYLLSFPPPQDLQCTSALMSPAGQKYLFNLFDLRFPEFI